MVSRNGCPARFTSVARTTDWLPMVEKSDRKSTSTGAARIGFSSTAYLWRIRRSRHKRMEVNDQGESTVHLLRSTGARLSTSTTPLASTFDNTLASPVNCISQVLA